LLAGGLVGVVTAGRHRYYRPASPEVGHVLEALALRVPGRRALRITTGGRAGLTEILNVNL
jgi:hypothetical protein